MQTALCSSWDISYREMKLKWKIPWNGQAQAECAAEGTRQVLECLLAGLAAAAVAAAAHLHCHPQTLQYHILLKKNLLLSVKKRRKK